MQSVLISGGLYIFSVAYVTFPMLKDVFILAVAFHIDDLMNL